MAGYKSDKPRECRYCYFWTKAKGCIYKGRTGCYYCLEETKPVSECDGCPYGQHHPCIGWCTKEVMRSLGLPRGREQQ